MAWVLCVGLLLMLGHTHACAAIWHGTLMHEKEPAGRRTHGGSEVYFEKRTHNPIILTRTWARRLRSIVMMHENNASLYTLAGRAPW